MSDTWIYETPSPNTVGDWLKEALEVYLNQTHSDYLEALGAMWAQLDLYVGLEAEDEGWGTMLSIDRAPYGALGYLGQYVGERLPSGVVETTAREWIQDAPNQRRGTLYSIVAAAQHVLVGSRIVAILERSGTGQPHPEDYISITTYSSQTPDPALVRERLYTVLPADIELNHIVATGQTWNSTKAKTWDQLEVDSWNTVITQLPGWTVISRPRPIPA